MRNTQKGFFSLPIILVVLAVLGGGIYFKLNSEVKTGGPFIVLPPDKNITSLSSSLNEKIFLGGGIYVTPLEVLSDSRCPVDVTCVWAGEVVLKVKLEKDGSSKEVEIKEGGTVDAGPGIVSLIDVAPKNNTKEPYADKDYKFTFKVSWKLD